MRTENQFKTSTFFQTMSGLLFLIVTTSAVLLAASSEGGTALYREGEAHVSGPRGPERTADRAGLPGVIERDEEIIIVLQGAKIVIGRQPGGSLTGLRELIVGGREVLSVPQDLPVPPPILEVLDDSPLGDIVDWPAYLVDRDANGGEWPSTGSREMHEVGMNLFQYIGYEIIDDTVTLLCAINDGGDQGEFEWIFAPAGMMLGETEYAGMGWKVRLTGVELASSIRVVEPAAPLKGDWAFAQVWGNFVESEFGAGEPFEVPLSTYFGDTQPYYFAGGPDGTILSYFESPVAAQVAIHEESARHIIDERIPMGDGAVRETPMKFWLLATAPLRSRWEAIDEWTSVYDCTADHYRDLLGLAVTALVPALEMRFPDEGYMANYIMHGPPPLEESWFYRYTLDELPMAAELGYRILRVVAWESDAEHSFSEYLPGSYSNGSGNAPWHLDISEALGGEEGLRVLVERAHQLGMKVVLWNSPGHLSNSSPILVEHPDWIMWRINGTPEDADWADVTGASLYSGYNDYALDRYLNARLSTNVDGFMVDSHLTFGVMTDFSRFQPVPQLGLTLQTHVAWREMGFTDVILEGCGPLGLSSGGLPGYDAFEPEVPPEQRREARQMLRRMLGREYGFYRYIVDTLVEPVSYYRALASKGHISPQYLDVLMRHPDEEIALIQQANYDYLEVMDRMQRRRLIADGDVWQGVEWSQAGSTDVVVFSFDVFPYPVAGHVLVQDVTTGDEFEAFDAFQTEPLHTYIVMSIPRG